MAAPIHKVLSLLLSRAQAMLGSGKFNSYLHRPSKWTAKSVFCENCMFLSVLGRVCPPCPGLIFYGGFYAVQIKSVRLLEVLQNWCWKSWKNGKIRYGRYKVVIPIALNLLIHRTKSAVYGHGISLVWGQFSRTVTEPFIWWKKYAFAWKPEKWHDHPDEKNYNFCLVDFHTIIHIRPVR